ncbi:uncharacterized protein N7483_013100 [Penicillium malachiteum]|uniref:uncharacterized protein n=1 Tax=Penicillium malachiteum TaxID=1324776 RepID=UPI0025488094|nr:uncharacterized protein N7483_013100 [Penicillium malachiteum]KAJ5715919.1 hypothetical protein N7483_013100 [Penicillium malachiteum]
MPQSASVQQLSALSITERICSTISLIGTSMIVITFLRSPSFRKSINRLVFYASWGNVMANIATLISQVGSMLELEDLYVNSKLSCFMPADALWTFAMACNVYLNFFHKYSSDQLRRLEWKHLICCYGLPFIPAFVYFFIQTDERGRVYGSAILWCWVSLQWDYLRIATFYGPVCFVIALTFAIYLRAGSVIYQKRRQRQIIGGIESRNSISTRSLAGIQVTREIACSSPVSQARSPHSSKRNSGSGASFWIPYSVTIEACHLESMVTTQSPPEASEYAQGSSSRLEAGPSQIEKPMRTVRSEGSESYIQRRFLTESNPAKWVYTKYAMLFFVALLVTWVPSTANRVCALVRPDAFSFGLNYASSFVLPLQGFWNSLIYVSISWPAFKTLEAKLRYRISEWRRLFNRANS